MAAADYPSFAGRYLDVSPPSTFALPTVAAPPGFVYLACVDGDDALDPQGLYPVEQGNYLAQIDLFTQGGHPESRLAGGEFLSVSQNSALFQLLGTTYGGDGEIDFVAPAVPSPVAHFAYFTASWGLFPSG